MVISFPVIVEGTQWMRLSFSEVLLSGDLFADFDPRARRELDAALRPLLASFEAYLDPEAA